MRVRDLEGAEGGTSWSERRDGCSELGSIWLSEVQRSTGAIADPGKSPTVVETQCIASLQPERPKKNNLQRNTILFIFAS